MVQTEQVHISNFYLKTGLFFLTLWSPAIELENGGIVLYEKTDFCFKSVSFDPKCTVFSDVTSCPHLLP